MKSIIIFAQVFLILTLAFLHAEEQPQLAPELAKLVAETHAASLKLRESALRKTIVKDNCFSIGSWGDNLWGFTTL